MTVLRTLVEMIIQFNSILEWNSYMSLSIENSPKIFQEKNICPFKPTIYLENIKAKVNLSLPHNQINSVCPKMFEYFPNLVSLNLDYNNISELPAEIFRSNKILKSFSFVRNSANVFSSEIFVNSPQLEKLFLDEIPYTLIFINASHLPVLDTLSLSGCSIATETFDERSTLPNSLKHLQLSKNDITSVPTFITNSLKNKQMIDFSIENNSLVCDCAAMDFIQAFNAHVAKKILTSRDPNNFVYAVIECSVPLSEKKYDLLEIEKKQKNIFCSSLANACPVTISQSCKCVNKLNNISCSNVQMDNSTFPNLANFLTKNPQNISMEISQTSLYENDTSLLLNFNIENFTLIEDEIQSFSNKFLSFEFCAKLLSLKVLWCNIYETSPQAFEYCGNLRKIDFSGSPLTGIITIFSDQFLPNLISLSLNEMRLTTLEEMSFPKNLAYLSLADNYFVVPEPTASFLQGFPNIKSIDIKLKVPCSCQTYNYFNRLYSYVKDQKNVSSEDDDTSMNLRIRNVIGKDYQCTFRPLEPISDFMNGIGCKNIYRRIQPLYKEFSIGLEDFDIILIPVYSLDKSFAYNYLKTLCEPALPLVTPSKFVPNNYTMKGDTFLESIVTSTLVVAATTLIYKSIVSDDLPKVWDRPRNSEAKMAIIICSVILVGLTFIVLACFFREGIPKNEAVKPIKSAVAIKAEANTKKVADKETIKTTGGVKDNFDYEAFIDSPKCTNE
ncbi:unnamed protein product [Gordionus sp. m RMFG-2023]